MKSIFLIGLLIGTQTWANCLVQVPDSEFNYEGYPISLTTKVYEILDHKGYRVDNSDRTATFRLDLKVVTERGTYFDHSYSGFEWITTADSATVYEKQFNKICLTERCGITDFYRPINKMLESLEKTIPICAR